jgi:MFS family permease
MQPDRRPTPAWIIGELLLNHPEAASLLARATHWRSLAAWSTANARRKFGAAQAARLAYEELGHLLEPRRRHLINLVVGLLLLVVLSAGLVMLDLIELGGLRSVQAALAATVVWLTGAWLGAVAARHRRWTRVAAIIGAGFLLGLLLVVLHAVAPHPAWPDVGRRVFFGALTGAFILVLTVGAAALMAYLESASLLVARRRWYRARAAYEEATEIEQADSQAAAVAKESWLGLVRARVATIAADDDQLVQATVAWAAALVGNNHSQLSPS